MTVFYYFRSPDHKPMPPPKTATYKPIPPPKPKNYRPPQQPIPDNYWSRTASSANDMNYVSDSPRRSAHEPPMKSPGDGREEVKSNFYHAKSYSIGDMGHLSNHLPPQNGLKFEEDSGGFDSGHGSSLDRNYDNYGQSPYNKMQPPSRGQYYYNIPPPREYHHREPSGLDLTNREQRGSAFELYKKPSDPRSPVHHYLDHNMRYVRLVCSFSYYFPKCLRLMAINVLQ